VKKTFPMFILKDEAGFTIVEVVAAAVILAFVIFATLRVITSSLNSIARQEKRMRALHIAQECVGRLEGESFDRVVPENFIVPSTRDYILESITYNSQIVDKDGNGTASAGDFKLYENNGTEISSGWSYDPANLKITNIPSSYEGKEVYVSYEYYHLIDEGGTIPSSDGEGRKKRVIKLTTDVGDTNGNGTAGEKDDILGDDLNTSTLYDLSSSDYKSFNPDTRELTFNEDKEGHSVWIYYLPENSNDLLGPEGTSDGYYDPTDTSIVGVVEGSFWDVISGCTTTAITPVKRNTVTEYWKQKDKIRKIELKTFIGK